MRLYTNLIDFIDADVMACKYKYRMSTVSLSKTYLKNKLYKEYAKEVTERIKILHDHICEKRMILSLGTRTWERMRKKILKKAKTLQDNENMTFVVYYEFDDNYEFTIEVVSTIK